MIRLPACYLEKTVSLACPECEKEERIEYDETDPHILNRFPSFDLEKEESQAWVFLCRVCGTRFCIEKR